MDCQVNEALSGLVCTIDSGTTDSLSNLKWEESDEELKEQTCMRVNRTNRTISIVLSDCSDSLSFICIPSKGMTSATGKTEETTSGMQMAPSSNELSAGNCNAFLSGFHESHAAL